MAEVRRESSGVGQWPRGQASLGLKLRFYLLILGGLLHATAHSWRMENSLQGMVLSFHHVATRDGTQVFRLGSKNLILSATSPA